MPNKAAINLTKIWREFGPNTYPIDMSGLVNEIINKMDTDDRLVLKYDAFDSFDGLMMPTDRPHQWVAIINTSITSEGRKNFTAAHEIYHYLGHRNIQDRFQCSRGDISRNKKNNIEKEANDFASQLILPPDQIRPKTKDVFNYENVKYVADSLGASVSAVAYKWLELSAADIAFIVSRDGFIVHGFPSSKAKEKGVFIKRDTEIPSVSITASCLHECVSASGTVNSKVWHPLMGAEERVYVGNDGYTYTFLEFLV